MGFAAVGSEVSALGQFHFCGWFYFPPWPPPPSTLLEGVLALLHSNCAAFCFLPCATCCANCAAQCLALWDSALVGVERRSVKTTVYPTLYLRSQVRNTVYLTFGFNLQNSSVLASIFELHTGIGLSTCEALRQCHCAFQHCTLCTVHCTLYGWWNKISSTSVPAVLCCFTALPEGKWSLWIRIN